jgi:hypothetical protein
VKPLGFTCEPGCEDEAEQVWGLISGEIYNAKKSA